MNNDVLLNINGNRSLGNGFFSVLRSPFSVLRSPFSVLRLPLTVLRLAALLLLLPTGLWAQDLQVCEGKGFTLASGADAVGTSPVTYTWYENGVAVGSSNTASLGVPAGRAAGTYAYVRMASSADCPDPLPSNTYTVEVLDAPAPPTDASSNARCGAGAVTFSATVPAGVTIDWYTADTGGTLVSGGGSVTSFSPSINASTTYYAEARYAFTGCASTSRLAVGAHVGTPAAAAQPVDPACGCASGLSDCNGFCQSCCQGTPCPGINAFTCEPADHYSEVDPDNYCSKYGEGWRLPTADELVCICDALKSGNGTAYWGQTWMLSSTPHPTFGWPTLSTVEWPSCRAGYSPTPYYGSVPRCVK